MLKKKLAVLLTAGLAAAMLAGCGNSAQGTGSSNSAIAGDNSNAGSSSTSDEGSSSESSGPIKVGIVNRAPQESSYHTAIDNDLKSTFTEENGYEASFVYYKKNKKQIAAAEEFVQAGVDYLLLSAADTSGWDLVLKDAQEAGTRVILFDCVVDADEELYAASVAPDMAAEGEMAIDWLKEQNLGTYEIVHLQEMIGSAEQVGRSAAMIEAAGTEGWTLVTEQTANGSQDTAKQIVESVIASGRTFNVIYAESDDMAKGAVAALDEAGISHGVGKDVIIMSFNANQYALQALLDQEWNYDGQCSPFQAAYIEEVIGQLESGGELEEKTVVVEDRGFDAATITEDDVEQYGI